MEFSIVETADQPRPARFTRPGMSWGWWDQVILRSPGFPAKGVESLSAPDLAAHADRVATAPNDDGWTEFERHFDRGTRDIARRLQAIAASPAFRRAVTWQNHRVLETGIEPLLRWNADSDSRNSKHRQHEELVASYWQRYCLKNDSIAFFGPVGWGRLNPEARRTTVQHGDQLVSSCDVFFEIWAIDRLAEALASDAEMRPWLKPWRLPHVRVDGDSVFALGTAAQDLPPDEAEILRACNGLLRCRDLAQTVQEALARRGLEQRITTNHVEQVLRRFEKARWLRLTIALPIVPRPEEDLRSFITGIEDDDVARPALTKLDKLETAMASVRDAAGDHDKLAHALSNLDSVFTTLTGAKAARHPGRAYAGRTLAYMDCRRDVEFEIGDDILQAAAPLDLLAESGRWLCYQLSAALRPRLDAIYERLTGDNKAAVRLSNFWFEALSPVNQGAQRELDALEAEFRDRWVAVLDLPYDIPHAAYAAESLAPKLRAAFNAPAPGWGAARYCSPDLLLAAPDLEHVHSGRFQLVLGELHLAINTQRHYCFVTQHPDPSQLFASVDRDTPRPRLLPVLPKASPPRLSIRTHPALVRPADYLVAYTHQTVAASRPRLVQACDVLVAKRDGDLVVILPDEETFDILEVFSEILVGAVINRFRIVPKRAHIPRISFDRLIVNRETWRMDISTLTFASLASETRRFVEARSWRKHTGIPERVFVSFEDGEKPFYVDFSSPVSVNVFARAVRRRMASVNGTSIVAVSEMLPTLDQLWLTDSSGARYAAEFRLTAFDLLGVGN
jgi:hypothetical protein